MNITAKFSGKCTECAGVIPAGSPCVWERGAGVRHVGECPKAAQAAKPTVVVQMGVFRKDGKIYVVKPNREKTKCYAKEIVESPARMTENGAVAEFEAVYRPGVIYKLTEADRWDIADAQDFLTKFARCIVCGRHLKAAKSVAGAIGPVCRKYFAHNKNYDAVAFTGAAKPAAKPAAKLGDYWVDDAGRAHTEPEPGIAEELAAAEEREADRLVDQIRDEQFAAREEAADRYENELIYGDA